MIKATCDHCKNPYDLTDNNYLGRKMPDLCDTCIEEYKERVIPLEDAYHALKKEIHDEYGMPYDSFTSMGKAADMLVKLQEEVVNQREIRLQNEEGEAL